MFTDYEHPFVVNTTSDEVETRDVQYVVNINDHNNNSNNSSNNNGGCELCEAENMEMRILKTEEAKFSTKQIAVLALTIGPIWFVSEVSKCFFLFYSFIPFEENLSCLV